LGAGFCVVQIRIQIRDKWGWCSGSIVGAGERGEKCGNDTSGSPVWKVVTDKIRIERDR